MSADYRTLHHLHRAATQQFRYASDFQAYGIDEYWVSPKELKEQIARNGFVLGDCDDFASLCVMLARQQGLPARFVMCLTENGESHLVAEVDGWILDNRFPDAVNRDDTNYTWLTISGFNAGDPWHLIKGE